MDKDYEKVVLTKMVNKYTSKTALWLLLPLPAARTLFQWDNNSSYIKEPQFFKDLPVEPPPLSNIEDAGILAIFGDTITTDHISPAGVIPVDSPADCICKDLV